MIVRSLQVFMIYYKPILDCILTVNPSKQLKSNISNLRIN